MGKVNKIIGRQKEIALLQEIVDSSRAEFVAVYGRRRIGKTYLIDKFFDEQYPQIRNPTKVSERCGPNRQECDFSSLD